MENDRIEKTTVLQAPRARVWKALSDIKEFRKWFGIQFNGPFVPGARLEGKVLNPGYENLRAEITVERVLPEQVLSWRWHPHAIDPDRDYSTEPMTLVAFALADAEGGGTRLTIVESGFDNIPSNRRQEAYRENEDGWNQQLDSIRQHVSKAA
jgi:uncharacterized protein YndB with AHSA1/START domain